MKKEKVYCMEKNYLLPMLLTILIMTYETGCCASEDKPSLINSAIITTNTSTHKQLENSPKKSHIFGYDFLKNKESGKLKNVPVAVQPDYILKPGDEININIWGDLNLHYTFTLNSDGYIVIPDAGRIFLNALTYGETKKKILNALGKTYAFYINAENPGAGKAQVDISMGKTAGIHVFVTGEVINPGDISCKGVDSSIFNVIKKAGGLTEGGSVRNIKLRKLTGKEFNFDLYNFLMKGKLPEEFKYLNDGDIIYIPLINKQVTISGSVKREGSFELLSGEKLIDAIELAGGLTPNAVLEVKITRIVKGETADKIINVNIEKSGNFELCDNDAIRVLTSENSSKAEAEEIFITGEVKLPGNYHYMNGEKIVELLQRAGGLDKSAFPAGSKLIRNNAPYIISLDKAIEYPESEYNFILFPGDRIEIPRINYFINIRGAVEKPSNILYVKDKQVSYYIKEAGGYKKNADKGAVKIIKANDSIMDTSSGSWFSSDPEVPFGSIIEIPEK